MITYTKDPVVFGTNPTKRYVEGHCLSTDTKPTAYIANGSMLLEMDTGKVFMFDEEHTQWEEF